MASLDAAQPAPQQDEAEPFEGRGLESYKRMFQRAEDAHANARKLAHRDRDWHDNFNDSQWSGQEKAVLEKRRQPIVTSNRIKRKVGMLCGLEQRQRSDPAAFPRKPNDEVSADIATDVLDYIETDTRFDNTASQSFRDLAIEGIEACEVIVEAPDKIRINILQYDGFFYDPRSKKRDFSDARYLGYQDWFDEEEAYEMAQKMGLSREDAERVIQGTMEGVTDDGYSDKPDHFMWADAERKRVRIACMYWKNAENQWCYVYFTSGGVIKEGLSVYLDDEGKPDCAIIATSAAMTRKNERFGIVRDMISPQSEMNFRRSQALFAIKQKRLWQRGDGVLPPNAREVVNRADGLLTANGVFGQDWGFLDNQQEIANNFELLQESKAEIDAQGPTAALQGRGTEDQSGRAIIAQQQSGITEENDIFDAHNDWKQRVYRAMWFRAKQFWREEKWIRITEENEAPRFVGLNTPKTVPMMDPMTGQPVMGPDGQPQPAIDPMTGKPQVEIDPMTGEPVLENVLAELDADIILQLAPDSLTLQHEEFVQLTQMASSGVPIPPDVLIQASQLREKNKLLDRMKEEMGAQAQLQKAGQQIEQMQKVIEQLQQELQKAMQQPSPKPMSQLDMARAQTEQIKGQTMMREQGRKEAETRYKIDSGMAELMNANAPQMLSPLELAEVENKRAQTDKTRADTAQTVANLFAPPPEPNGSAANR